MPKIECQCRCGSNSVCRQAKAHPPTLGLREQMGRRVRPDTVVSHWRSRGRFGKVQAAAVAHLLRPLRPYLQGCDGTSDWDASRSAFSVFSCLLFSLVSCQNMVPPDHGGENRTTAWAFSSDSDTGYCASLGNISWATRKLDMAFERGEATRYSKLLRRSPCDLCLNVLLQSDDRGGSSQLPFLRCAFFGRAFHGGTCGALRSPSLFIRTDERGRVVSWDQDRGRLGDVEGDTLCGPGVDKSSNTRSDRNRQRAHKT